MQVTDSIELLCRRAFFIACLVTGFLSGALIPAHGTEIKHGKWYSGQHDFMVGCHSLLQGEDGEYSLRRYFFISPEFDRQAHNEQSSQGDTIAGWLKGVADAYPDNAPFYMEHYNLDHKFNIRNGHLIKGKLEKEAASQSPLGFAGVSRDIICGFADRTLGNLGLDGIWSEDDWDQAVTMPGVSIAHIDEIGIQAFPPHDGGIILPDQSAPLVLIALGLANKHNSVFDPLDRREAISFRTADFNLYNNPDVLLPVTLGVSSGMIAAGGLFAIAFDHPVLSIPMLLTGLAGTLGSAYLGEYHQAPYEKAQALENSLLVERGKLVAELVIDRSERESHRFLLFEKYGMSGDETVLKAYLHDYSLRAEFHSQSAVEERDQFQQLKMELRKAEDALHDIEDQRLRLELLNTRVCDLNEKIRKIETAGEDLIHLGISKSGQSLEGLHRELLGVVQEREKLRQQGEGAQRDEARLQMEILNLERRIQAVREPLGSQDNTFAHQISAPKRHLEKFFSICDEIASKEKRRNLLDEKIDQISQHKKLMEFVGQYRQYTSD